MKKKLKQYVSIICCGAICATMFPVAGAIGTDSSVVPQEMTFTETVESDIDFNAGNQYDIVFSVPTHTAFDYLYLEDILSNTPTVWENTEKNLKAYDLTELQLNIPDLDNLVEVSFNDGTYNISYYKTSGEFVILEYLPDGTVNRYVRESKNENLDCQPTDADVIFYDGVNNSVFRYQNTNYPSVQSKKTVDFPSPTQKGFTDTGSKGKLVSTKSLYISQLQKNLTARVMKVETNYKRTGSGWYSWTMNTALSVVAAKYGWSTLAVANFLSGAGVAVALVSGAWMLKEELSLPKYPDYTADDGKCGDIYDTTRYNAYCRVYQNVGTSKYISGIDSSGNFSYVKKGYTGIKTDDEVFSKVQSLFNSVIATHGYNALYSPV